MADPPTKKEVRLSDLEVDKLGTQEKSLGEIVREQIGARERAQIADIVSITICT